MMMKKACGSERSGVRRLEIVVGYLHHFKRSPLGLLLRLASGKDALHLGVFTDLAAVGS